MPSPPTGPSTRVRLGGGLVLACLSCALLASPDRPQAAGILAATPVGYAACWHRSRRLHQGGLSGTAAR